MHITIVNYINPYTTRRSRVNPHYIKFHPVSIPITPFNKKKETASIQRKINNSHHHRVEAEATHESRVIIIALIKQQRRLTKTPSSKYQSICY